MDQNCRKAAERVVSQWLLDTWVGRPKWMIRMPDMKEIDDLVSRIAAELEK